MCNIISIEVTDNTHIYDTVLICIAAHTGTVELTFAWYISHHISKLTAHRTYCNCYWQTDTVLLLYFFWSNWQDSDFGIKLWLAPSHTDYVYASIGLDNCLPERRCRPLSTAATSRYDVTTPTSYTGRSNHISLRSSSRFSRSAVWLLGTGL